MPDVNTTHKNNENPTLTLQPGRVIWSDIDLNIVSLTTSQLITTTKY